MEGRQDMAVKEFFCPGMIGIFGTGAAPALPDLVPGLLQYLLIGGVFPQHQILNNLKKPLSLPFLGFFRLKQV